MKFPNIAAERARNDMTLDELAAACRVSRKSLFNWEKAGRIPPDKLAIMADLFHCSEEYLAEVVEAE